MGTRCLLILASVIGLSTAKEVEQELAAHFRATGLGIVINEGDRVRVIPVDGSKSNLWYGKPALATTFLALPSGRGLMWAVPLRLFPDRGFYTDLLLQSVLPASNKTFRLGYAVDLLAISEKLPRKIAYIRNWTEFVYGSLTNDTPTVITGTSNPASAGWSPDGRRLVFSRAGTVRVLDTSSGKIIDVAQGDDPTWSPDGRWLIYRKSASAYLFDLSMAMERQFLSGRVIAPLPLRWSPDSAYVAYVEQVNRGGSWTLSVARILDGERVSILTFSPEIGYLRNWGWVEHALAFVTRR